MDPFDEELGSHGFARTAPHDPVRSSFGGLHLPAVASVRRPSVAQTYMAPAESVPSSRLQLPARSALGKRSAPDAAAASSASHVATRSRQRTMIDYALGAFCSKLRPLVPQAGVAEGYSGSLAVSEDTLPAQAHRQGGPPLELELVTPEVLEQLDSITFALRNSLQQGGATARLGAEDVGDLWRLCCLCWVRARVRAHDRNPDALDGSAEACCCVLARTCTHVRIHPCTCMHACIHKVMGGSSFAPEAVHVGMQGCMGSHTSNSSLLPLLCKLQEAACAAAGLQPQGSTTHDALQRMGR